MAKRQKLTPEGVAVGLLRLLRGWNQTRLARASGIDKAAISRYERGLQLPSQRTLERLCIAARVRFSCIAGLIPSFRRALADIEQGLEETAPPGWLTLGADAQGALARLGLPRKEASPRRPDQARQEAQELWEYLKGRSARDRRVLVDGGREYKRWALCERLCSASEQAAAHDAGEAVALAELAVRVAELVPAAPGEESFKQGLQGYAWAYLGNARRVQGNHPGADEAFACSDRFLSTGAAAISALLDTALLPDLKASLRRHQGRFEEALKLHALALSLAKSEDRGALLLNKAKTLEEMERIEDSIATLMQAEPLIDTQRKPRELFALRFNLAINLGYLGKYEEAEALLPKVEQLVTRLATRLDQLRFRWLEGKIAAGLGRRDEALAAFSQVRAAFIERGIAFDTALVSLELAVVHLELSQTGEVKTLARQMVAIFEAQGGHREALAALRLYRETAEKEAVTVELTRQVMDYLNRARRNPELKFQS